MHILRIFLLSISMEALLRLTKFDSFRGQFVELIVLSLSSLYFNNVLLFETFPHKSHPVIYHVSMIFKTILYSIAI